MVSTAYLRVYQPLGAFPEHERHHWLKSESDDAPPLEPMARKWLVTAALPELSLASPREGAFVRRIGDQVLVCPWRTHLRMLAGLLAFRNSLPDEVADAFVPEEEARRAAHDLASLTDERPDVRSHILSANWHVPLRWFVGFEDAERILTEDKDGLRIRYETPLSDAAGRLSRAIDVLEKGWVDDAVTAAVRELLEWLQEFPEGGLLELDYGSVARMFDDEELLEDRSAGEVEACLTALSEGDVVTAGRLFSTLTDRWTDARAQEVVN